MIKIYVTLSAKSQISWHDHFGCLVIHSLKVNELYGHPIVKFQLGFTHQYLLRDDNELADYLTIELKVGFMCYFM